MSKPILYHTKISPPVRSVLLTAKAIELDLELREINLLQGDQLNESFKKKNPQHTIPTLEDGTNIIWDSHAIVTYLIGKYGKNDLLYPKNDLVKRAKIDQRLHFDSGILFARLRGALEPLFFGQEKTIPEDKLIGISRAYDFMETFLENDKYLVGNSLTVADLCCITTVSSLNVLVPIDEQKCPNLVAWIRRMEKLPYYNINQEGVDQFRPLYEQMSG